MEGRGRSRTPGGIRRSFGPHPWAAGRLDSRSYLQIVFRAEHVRISNADTSEGHRDKDRSLRLLPAVVPHLQGHPGRQTERLVPRDSIGACSVAREAGVATFQPFRVRRGPGAASSQLGPDSPGDPWRPPHYLGVLEESLDHFLASYYFRISAKSEHVRKLGPHSFRQVKIVPLIMQKRIWAYWVGKRAPPEASATPTRHFSSGL